MELRGYLEACIDQTFPYFPKVDLGYFKMVTSKLELELELGLGL